MLSRYWTAAAGCALVTGGLWLTSPHAISDTSVAIAFLLLLAPWISYTHWKGGATKVNLPLFSAIAFMHWIYFALPLFWGSRRVESRFAWTVAEDLVTPVMAMVLLGVGALWVGMRVVPVAGVRAPGFDLELDARSRHYLHAVILGATVLNGVTGFAYAFGESGRQLIVGLTSLVPFTGLAILLHEHLSGRSERSDRVVIFTAIGMRAVLGLASGWAGSLAQVAILSTAVYLKERRRLPAAVLTVAVCALLFLQAGKTSFRVNYWYGEGQGGPVEKIGYWLAASTSEWSKAADDPEGRVAMTLMQNTLMRVSLLEQAANVLLCTPSLVEFQHGATYSFLAVTLIPRFLWPDKPSVNEANRFYQLNYGFSTLKDLDRVSIAVGFLTEGYINFGYEGVAGVMFLVGCMLGVFQRVFFHVDSGLLWTAAGMALLAPLLTIESQLAQYVGGLPQQIALTLAAFIPVLRVRTVARPGLAGVVATS